MKSLCVMIRIRIQMRALQNFTFLCFSFLIVFSVKMFVTFEPVDADTVCGDVLCVLFYPWKKFLSGFKIRKSLWLSDKKKCALISRYAISLFHLLPATYCRLWTGAPNDNFRKNICSEDDMRSRIFETFVVKLLACLPLLGFSNIQNMVYLPIFNGFLP